MPDPAVEAAQRAIGHLSPDEFTNEVGDTVLASAREMAKPIQEFVDSIASEIDCWTGADVLRELAPLIYSTEELENRNV